MAIPVATYDGESFFGKFQTNNFVKIMIHIHTAIYLKLNIRGTFRGVRIYRGLKFFFRWLRPRSAVLISRLKNTVSWFVVRKKYCFGWKNKLKSTDYKPDEQLVRPCLTRLALIVMLYFIGFTFLSSFSLKLSCFFKGLFSYNFFCKTTR
jgi:hypothetical protein